MALKKVEHAAPKKQAMTLDDLEAFVRDARRTGATGREEVQVGMSWGGKLQKLAVEVDMTSASRVTIEKGTDAAP